MKFVLLICVLLSLEAQAFSLSKARKIADEAIELDFTERIIQGDARFKNADIGIEAFNGQVLLYGTVATKSLKQLATRAVKNNGFVRKVFNQMQIGKQSDSNTTIDAFMIKLEVEKTIIFSDVPAVNIETVLYNDSLYLLGVVERKASEELVQALRETSQIRNIYTLFEYIE